MSFKIIDRDHGYKKFLREVFSKGQTQLEVGVLADEGSKKHAKSDLTVLEIATIHEFGLGNNPERSFIRAWFDENKEQNEELLFRLAEQVIAGKLTREQAMNQAGLRFVAGIQKRITDRIPPPLKQATIMRKGSTVPLVDTGQLKSSITYKLV